MIVSEKNIVYKRGTVESNNIIMFFGTYTSNINIIFSFTEGKFQQAIMNLVHLDLAT